MMTSQSTYCSNSMNSVDQVKQKCFLSVSETDTFAEVSVYNVL